ncbi:MAG: hypothetical protein JW737_01885 [Acidobacteria bacterium]|nr:hypothetical protein [Acidobacteriota bacterium]
MVKQRQILVILLISLIFIGWTSKTHQKIVVEASKLTPYELKLLLTQHKKAVLEGAISPLGEKKGEEHFLLVDGSYGKAHEMIEMMTKKLIADMRARKITLEQFCFEMGKISHYVAEVNNPILTGDTARRANWIYTKFVQYTDSQLSKFILSFDGYKNIHLEKGDYQGFAIASAIRSSKLFSGLYASYQQARVKKNGFMFDDRSIPFAAASLSYNYSVTDTARIWYYIWKELTGNTDFAPYDDTSPKKK